MAPRAFITGVTGQDGSYLAEFLLERGYEVHGLVRSSSSANDGRIAHLDVQARDRPGVLHLHDGDLKDSGSLMRIIDAVKPDEVYNLAAQSHVGLSYATPEYTADVNAIGPTRLLEAIRNCGLADQTRYYQASTSELFGMVRETPQTETTPFYPRSPYAVAKLYAYWVTVNYREAYGMYACNGILFNHESPRRGENFVTRKITRGLTRIALGLQSCLHLGNLDAERDWGHARDFVEMQWLMLQQDKPEDFVIATGVKHSVRQFVIWAAAELGITLEFSGTGLDEIATVIKIGSDEASCLQEGDVIVRVDPRYFRPAEVDLLLGNAQKARTLLGWVPKTSVPELCAEMVASDLKLARQEALQMPVKESLK